MQKPDLRPEMQMLYLQNTLNKRYGLASSPNTLPVASHMRSFPTEYIGCISDQDNKDVIRQLKFSYVKWFAKNNWFALGYNKVNNLKKQGHYSIFDLNEWKLHYKKFAMDEAMVGLLGQEYMNKVIGLGSQGGIYIIDKGQEKLEQKPVITINEIRDVSDGSFSPTHAKIALSSSDKSIYIYDVAGGQKDVMRGHGKEVLSVMWNPTYNLILSGSDDETIRIWDPLKREEVSNLKRHNLGVKKVRWNSDGIYFLTTGKDKQTMLFDLRKTDGEIMRLPPAQVDCIQWHPKYSNIFMSGDQFGTVKGWSVNAPQQPIFQSRKQDTSVTDFAVDQTGLYMAVIRARPMLDPKTNQPDLMEVFKTL